MAKLINSDTQPVSRPVVAYFAIIFTWFFTRAYPIWQAEPWQYWEIWEAKKLLEYGFWMREGGIINIHFMTGLVEHPEKFNYVNHPYPILWAFTFLYYLFGTWGPLAAKLACGLASTIAVFPALKILFPRKVAFVGTFFYLLAPTTILTDVNTNIITLGSAGWPFLMLSLAGLEQKFSGLRALVFAGLVFVLGQISWFTYTVVGTIFVVLAFKSFLERSGAPDWKRKVLPFLIAGGALTVATFIFQIIYYTYDFAEIVRYARGQSQGIDDGISTIRMAIAIGLRTALSVGPALLLGGVISLYVFVKRPSRHWLVLISFAYLLTFFLAGLVLSRFYFRETSMYQYLAFPLTVVAVFTIEKIGSRLLTWCLVALSVAALIYPIYQASIPVVSQTSHELAPIIKSETQSRTIIATNMKAQMFPFSSWDVGSRGHVSMLSDRLIRWGIVDTDLLATLPAWLKEPEVEVTYLYCPDLPIDKNMNALLESKTPTKSIEIKLPAEPLPFATRLRSLYWKLAGKHQAAQASTAEAPHFQIYFYKIPLKALQN